EEFARISEALSKEFDVAVANGHAPEEIEITGDDAYSRVMKALHAHGIDPTAKVFNPDEARDDHGRWVAGGGEARFSQFPSGGFYALDNQGEAIRSKNAQYGDLPPRHSEERAVEISAKHRGDEVKGAFKGLGYRVVKPSLSNIDHTIFAHGPIE